MRRFLVLVVVVILFRRHASDKFQGTISYHFNHNLDISLELLTLKYVLSDHFRSSNVPVNQNKLKMCLHFDEIRTLHRCLKLAFFGLYIYLKPLKTVPSG